MAEDESMTSAGQVRHSQPHDAQLEVLRFRSHTQVLWNVAVFAMFVLIAIGSMIESGRVGVGGVVFALGPAMLAARSLSLRVVTTPTEVRVHSWWVTRRFAREDIADLRPVPYDGMWVRGSESPTWAQLQLTTHDGQEHHLRAVITLAANRKAQVFSDAVMGRERATARHLQRRV